MLRAPAVELITAGIKQLIPSIPAISGSFYYIRLQTAAVGVRNITDAPEEDY